MAVRESKVKDQSWKEIVPKSCSNYKDYFALDMEKWTNKLYKNQKESYMYIPEMPNRPSGR